MVWIDIKSNEFTPYTLRMKGSDLTTKMGSPLLSVTPISDSTALTLYYPLRRASRGGEVGEYSPALIFD